MICHFAYFDGAAHAQIIICRQLFVGYAVGCRPIKGKKNGWKATESGLRRQVEGGKPGTGGAASEGVLANFFNSLLNKKSGTGAAMGRGGTAVRSDAAAELDRMNRAKKMVPQGNAANDTTESS